VVIAMLVKYPPALKNQLNSLVTVQSKSLIAVCQNLARVSL